MGLKLTLHKWKSAWKVAFSLVKVTPRLFCRNSFVLLAPNTDHACEWNRCAALQVPWKWLPIAFTDNIQVSKDTLTEMLHLPLSKVRNKCDDCSSKYLQKNLPAVLAGRKMSVPTKWHHCTPQTTARTSFFEVSQQVAKEWTFFF